MTLIKKADPVPSLGPLKERKKEDPNSFLNLEKEKKPAVKSISLVKKMQNDIHNFAKTVLNNSSNNVIYNLISSQSGTNFNIINTMKDIISNPKKNVDGIWGLGTQAALNDVYRTAVALLNTNAKFDLKVSGYDLSDLSNLRKLLSGYEFKNNRSLEPLNRQNERAKIISTHLSALVRYYNAIVRALIKDERLKTEDPDGLVEYKQRQEIITEEEDKFLKEQGDRSVHVKVEHDQSVQQIPVPIWVLKDKEQLAGWLEKEQQKKSILRNYDVASFFNEVLKPQLLS